MKHKLRSGRRILLLVNVTMIRTVKDKSKRTLRVRKLRNNNGTRRNKRLLL
jgi:hypothetical protein